MHLQAIINMHDQLTLAFFAEAHRNRMNIPRLLLVAVLGACLTQGLPTPLSVKQDTPIPITVRHRLLSLTTGRYVSITKSGRVHANGHINTNNRGKY